MSTRLGSSIYLKNDVTNSTVHSIEHALVKFG